MKPGESSGSSNAKMYRVEARTKDGQPIKLGDQLFAGNWTEVRFTNSEIGVRAARCREALSHGLMEYAAAKAMQHWFISDTGISNIETRIVSFNFSTTYKIERLQEEKAQTWFDIKFIPEGEND